jgi:DNA-binding Xre family transcriptional regulator
VTRQVSYRWHLRQLMATRGMFATSDLAPHLAERGIQLSPAQVWRLVTTSPERLNLHVLAALCDILGCTPADLIEPVAQPRTGRTRKTAAGGRTTPPVPASSERQLRPRRARIVDDAQPEERR